MPYYIDPETKTIFVGGFYADVNSSFVKIDENLCTQLDLRHGQVLSTEQITALRAGDAQAFEYSQPGTSTNIGEDAPHDRSTLRDTAQLGSVSRPMPASVARARAAAGTVEAFSWVILVLGVIAGIAVALQTDYAATESGIERVHPYVGQGIGIAIVVAMNCLMIIMVAAYIKAKMELARRAG
jgi:hypothetical protein